MKTKHKTGIREAWFGIFGFNVEAKRAGRPSTADHLRQLQARCPATPLSDALLAECEIENKIQDIILFLLEEARDESLHLKPRDPYFLSKWQRKEGNREWLSNMRRRLLVGAGFTEKNFNQAIRTLKNRGRIRIYGMTRADGVRADIIAVV